jgi:hypothetical protein
LEAIGCVGPTLSSIAIILLLYLDVIILMSRNPYDLIKQLLTLKDFFSSTSLTMNIDKMKVMIIKSNKISYDDFEYDNNMLEGVPSYKYLGIDIHHKLKWNYSIEKKINGGWKDYYGIENNCKLADLWLWDKKNLLFETVVSVSWAC